MKRSFLIKPMLGGDYPKAVYGRGVYIFDDNGKKYLDGSSGAVTASIGHAVPEIIEAMKRQAEKISFVYRSQFTTEEAEQLAEKLSRYPFVKDYHYHSFFINSGSEATETAMKIAIQYWQEKGQPTKKRVVSRWTSYHGITMGALSLSGHSERRKRFVSLLEDSPIIPAPNCYRCPYQLTFPDCKLRCAKELDIAVMRIGADHIAAFIAEPIVGAAGGVIVPPPGYYERVKEICDHHQILFIADEVMTGLGRTGKMFAMEHWGVLPDMIALGKGMTAGYTPMAATLVSEKVMAPIQNGSKLIMSGHTFSANPQSAAVSLAVLQYIDDHRLVEKAEKNGDYLLKQLQSIARLYPIIGEVRGKGFMIGVELVMDPLNKTPFRKEISLTNTIIQKARDRGLLLYPASAGEEGGEGDAVIISPPLTIEKDEIDQLIHIFQDTISTVQREMESYMSIRNLTKGVDPMNSMRKEQINSWLIFNREQGIELLQKLVQTKSTQGYEKAVQEIVLEELKELGLDVDIWEPDGKLLAKSSYFASTRVEFQGSPNVVGILKGSGQGRSIVLNGHVDVVPEGDLEQWEHDPYSGEIKDGKMYGRGVTDMKGGNVALLLAIKAIVSLGIKLKGDVIFHSVVEEESGGAGTLAAIIKGYRADAAIIPEPTNMKIFPKQQGSMWFRIHIKGRSAHGGTRYEGISAIEKSLTVLKHIGQLEEIRNVRVIDELYQNIPIPFPINVGRISGGDWPSSVPDLVTIEGRMGVSPSETIEQAKYEMEKWLSELGEVDPWFEKHPPNLEWFGARWLPGSIDVNHDLMNILVSKYIDVLNDEPVIEASPWGTDGGLLTEVGQTPSIVFGPGVTEMAHFSNEYIVLDRVFEVAEIIALTLLEWCGVED